MIWNQRIDLAGTMKTTFTEWLSFQEEERKAQGELEKKVKNDLMEQKKSKIGQL